MIEKPLIAKATEDRTYDYQDLLRAYLDSVRFDACGWTEFADYYRTFFESLCGLFEVDINPSGKGRSGFYLFLLPKLARAYADVKSPWDGIDVIPPFLGDFFERHGRRFDATSRTMRTDIFEAMREIYVECFGETDRVATSEQLRQAGVDDRNPPDYLAALMRETD